MSEYLATIRWKRDEQAFTDNNYSRAHLWEFDGGLVIPASPSPNIVPAPHSVAENVDPEEAFIASLSSCHMLFFLSLAAAEGCVVDSYTDEASGTLGKGSDGRMAMTQVRLRPNASYSGKNRLSLVQLEELHHRSHDMCFIANSVKTEIVTEVIA
jgi:organic hydroperoxide reductase OsmC/OhrA